jgi:hypothetical protein
MKMSPKATNTARKELTQEAVKARNQQKKPARTPAPATEFGRTLKDLLGKTFKPNEVNEEELFAATAHQLIFNRYGSRAADDFKSAFKLNMADKPKTEKFPSAERAAKESLKFFVNSTLITKDEAREIRQLAFTTCQLDENLDVAWDGMGDTKAVTSFSNGEKLIQGRLEASGNAPIIASRRSKPNTDVYGKQASPKASKQNPIGAQVKRSA